MIKTISIYLWFYAPPDAPPVPCIRSGRPPSVVHPRGRRTAPVAARRLDAGARHRENPRAAAHRTVRQENLSDRSRARGAVRQPEHHRAAGRPAGQSGATARHGQRPAQHCGDDHRERDLHPHPGQLSRQVPQGVDPSRRLQPRIRAGPAGGQPHRPRHHGAGAGRPRPGSHPLHGQPAGGDRAARPSARPQEESVDPGSRRRRPSWCAKPAPAPAARWSATSPTRAWKSSPAWK